MNSGEKILLNKLWATARYWVNTHWTMSLRTKWSNPRSLARLLRATVAISYVVRD